MSATRTIIGEHDVVALLDDVGDWAAGTEGAVLGEDGAALREVEIVSEKGGYLDSVLVPVEQLRLIAKCPRSANIGLLDRVAILSPLDGWRIGTTGAVVADFPDHKMVEITAHLGESLDFLDVPTEHLRLIRKCPRPDRDFARARAIAGTQRPTPAMIAEHDVVELLVSVDGWPIGTSGTVISDSSGPKLVEISNHLGEELDFLCVPTDRLRLIWKCPYPTSKTAAD
jgi:hypothetical protein